MSIIFIIVATADADRWATFRISYDFIYNAPLKGNFYSFIILHKWIIWVINIIQCFLFFNILYIENNFWLVVILVMHWSHLRCSSNLTFNSSCILDWCNWLWCFIVQHESGLELIEIWTLTRWTIRVNKTLHNGIISLSPKLIDL